MSRESLRKTLSDLYNQFEGSDDLENYSARHGIESAGILTVFDDETAIMIAGYLEERIKGKTVVEIGGGIGLLSLHLGYIAKRVYCIEANPIWGSTFSLLLLKEKQRNVSYLLGTADEFVGCIKGDVAVVCTHSGLQNMKLVAAQFAPKVIDVYGELIEAFPDKFDKTATYLRKVS